MRHHDIRERLADQNGPLRHTHFEQIRAQAICALDKSLHGARRPRIGPAPALIRQDPAAEQHEIKNPCRNQHKADRRDREKSERLHLLIRRQGAVCRYQQIIEQNKWR